jgi:serine/threonine protein kinase
MLNSRKEIVVIDLGLGNFMKADELLSTFCGSTAYAAPEMFLCQVTAPRLSALFSRVALSRLAQCQLTPSNT